jgi:3-oxoacyl-[acyl-carrier protein] reductase/meso-butanediol dehydrogenase/(S,S)-butanediol dehydrogenase/diacetyl reductase
MGSQVLDHKVALVTGAGGMRGIGRAIALQLATMGADVVVTDVRRPPEDLPADEIESRWLGIESVACEVETIGRRCHPIWCDIREEDCTRAAVAEVIQRFGHIDILVNNARAVVGADVAPLTEVDVDAWRRVIDVNVTGSFLMTRFAAREMVRKGTGGRVVNIGSEASKRGIANMAAYSASKFALIGLTQAAALELAPHSITVNAVCPGAVDSGRMNHRELEDAREQGISPSEWRSQLIAAAAAATPLGRVGTPADVAALVSFLASDAAAFITGQAYNVNGGTVLH